MSYSPWLSCERAFSTINTPNHIKEAFLMLKWIDWTTLCQFEIFRGKKSMYIGVLKQVVWYYLRSRRILRPFWSLELRLSCWVVLYMLCQATEKLRELLEMIGTEISSSVIPLFKPIYINKLLCQSVICNFWTRRDVYQRYNPGNRSADNPSTNNKLTMSST